MDSRRIRGSALQTTTGAAISVGKYVIGAKTNEELIRFGAGLMISANFRYLSTEIHICYQKEVVDAAVLHWEDRHHAARPAIRAYLPVGAE